MFQTHSKTYRVKRESYQSTQIWSHKSTMRRNVRYRVKYQQNHSYGTFDRFFQKKSPCLIHLKYANNFFKVHLARFNQKFEENITVSSFKIFFISKEMSLLNRNISSLSEENHLMRLFLIKRSGNIIHDFDKLRTLDTF